MKGLKEPIGYSDCDAERSGVPAEEVVTSLGVCCTNIYLQIETRLFALSMFLTMTREELRSSLDTSCLMLNVVFDLPLE